MSFQFRFIRIGFSLLLFFGSSIGICQEPGESSFDQNGYVEYVKGNLPFIISVPHGGYLEPEIIPDRDCDDCVYLRDSYTQEMARSIIDEFYDQIGGYPHVIINLLHRKKFDANRDITEAADGDQTVEASWTAYHAFIETAKALVMDDFGQGLFVDLHGHAHDIQRIELGYSITSTDLQSGDNSLNTIALIEKSSLRNLVSNNLRSFNHAELLRGPYSLGSLIDGKSVDAVPSSTDLYPSPGDPFFSGGYNTSRHGSSNGGSIDGVQIECHQGVRFDEKARNDFAQSLTEVLNIYYDIHYHEDHIPDFIALGSDRGDFSAPIIIPNPVSDQFILINKDSNAIITLFDLRGHKILRTQWTGEPINVERLSEGLYIVTLEYPDDTKYSERVMIKR